MVGQFPLKAMASAVLVACVVLSAGAVNKAVTWSATDGLVPDDGTVVLALDANDRVTNLTVKALADVVTLSGTDALPFADGAEIRAATCGNGALILDLPVAGAGTLAFKSAFRRVSYENTADYLPEREEVAVVIARDLNLADVEPVHVVSRGASMGNCMLAVGTEYACLYETRGDGTYSCQAQVVDGGWTKCVKLCLRQVGRDIVAWTPQAWFASTENYGRDFTTFSANPQEVSCIATSTDGYGIYKVSLRMPEDEGMSRVVVKKAVTGVSTLTVDSMVGVTAEGEETLTSGSLWNTSLVLGGRFVVRNRGSLELSGDVTYLDGGEMELLADQEHPGAPSTLTMKDYPDKDERITIGYGISPSAITNVTATTCGGWFNEGKKMNAYQFHLTTNGMTCQLQHYDGTQYVKGIVLAFELEGTNLVAYVVDAKYTSASADKLGKVDLRSTGGSIAVYNKGQNGNDNGYGIKDITIHLSDVPYGRLIGISGEHTGALSRLYVTGSAHERIQVNILQDKNQAHFTVNTNAVLNFCPPSSATTRFDRTAPLFLNAGGEFWHNGEWTMDYGVLICFSGGVFRVAHDKAQTKTVQPLYRSATTAFLDGGRICEHGFRLGYYDDSVVTVRGTHPAYIEGGDLGIVGSDSVAKRTVTFDVDDVTGDEEPDLYAMERMYYSNAGSGWTNAVIVKTGAGTILAGVNEATTYPLTVRDGTWKLGCSGATDLRNDLLLEGGAIACAAGCTNAFRTTELAAGTVGLVKLDEGAELSFAAFTPGEGSCLSVLTAQVSERLRIGTSACLTGTQLRIIRLDGERVHQGADGYLHPGAPGTMLLFR